MRFPPFDLRTDSGAPFADADLQGQPWFVYLARHPGCFVCQNALREALEHRAEVRALGGDILVFFNATPESVSAWRERTDFPADLTVVVDPGAVVYEALGTNRGNVAKLVQRSAKELWKSKGDIRKWRLTNNDMLRMGADVAVAADGEIVAKHICDTPADRADPRTMIAALDPVAA